MTLADSIIATRMLDRGEQIELRRRVIFDAGKFDPHVFDHAAVAPMALTITPSEIAEIARLAESAWAELLRAEAVLASTPRTLAALGVPRGLRAAAAASTVVPSVRVARMDFHPTAEGWRVSEINADVPGGYIEAGAVTSIVHELLGSGIDLTLPPCPAGALAAAIARAVPANRCVALLHATAYSDDWQVMRAIASALEQRGLQPVLASPAHLDVDGDRVTVLGHAVGAIVRFFPGEWLANLPRRVRWREAMTTRSIIQCNPLSALAMQSKRLALEMAHLGLPTPVWSSIHPEVRSIGARALIPRLVPDGWVLKPVWGRVGDGVVISGVTSAAKSRRACIAARTKPKNWVLQRRFESLPIATPLGPRHVCLGVYVVQGAFAGIYGRMSERPLIDAQSQDSAVLVCSPRREASVVPQTRPDHVSSSLLRPPVGAHP